MQDFFKPDEMRPENLVVMGDFEEALVKLSADVGVGEIFVIGGASLYDLAFTKFSQHCKYVVATRINKKFECDVMLSTSLEAKDGVFSPMHISQTYSHDDITYDFTFFGNTGLLAEKPELIPTRLMEKYPRHPELQYLEIIDDVIRNGK